MSLEEEIETTHIFVEDFIERISKSEIPIAPEIISTALIKKASEIMKDHHGDDYSGYKDFVDKNFIQMNKLFFKERN